MTARDYKKAQQAAYTKMIATALQAMLYCTPEGINTVTLLAANCGGDMEAACAELCGVLTRAGVDQLPAPPRTKGAKGKKELQEYFETLLVNAVVFAVLPETLRSNAFLGISSGRFEMTTALIENHIQAQPRRIAAAG